MSTIRLDDYIIIYTASNVTVPVSAAAAAQLVERQELQLNQRKRSTSIIYVYNM